MVLASSDLLGFAVNPATYEKEIGQLKDNGRRCKSLPTLLFKRSLRQQ